jgi:hypothetical protein
MWGRWALKEALGLYINGRITYLGSRLLTWNRRTQTRGQADYLKTAGFLYMAGASTQWCNTGGTHMLASLGCVLFCVPSTSVSAWRLRWAGAARRYMRNRRKTHFKLYVQVCVCTKLTIQLSNS